MRSSDGNTSDEKSDTTSSGMWSKISGSSTKMPVLIVSLNTWPQVGFSRNRSIEPSSRVITIPNSSGFSTDTRPMVATASRASWNSMIEVRSMSVRTSPEITRKRSSSSALALRTDPAVPSGVSSVA